ncbi:hypothetical protein GCM10009654_57680 [Streptomyces hebeiensis]|uniref:Transposase DDE domain-containing protein n=1 Tax=Streptomyces hebeiensis TaxID=229486 RepID=A0ABN1V3G7_9ACTN
MPGCGCLPCTTSRAWHDAEPDTMRFRIYHLPARLADHARRRWLRIDGTWPWAEAFTTCWQRLTALPAIT